jgi:hypothetical protein
MFHPFDLSIILRETNIIQGARLELVRSEY